MYNVLIIVVSNSINFLCFRHITWHDQSSLTPKQKENEFQSTDKTRQQSKLIHVCIIAYCKKSVLFSLNINLL